ncbi:MAG TPA: alpha/beta hydrolase [Caulobacterales bacterium]|jgi:pimeloyl-ACP methyl ester carboxylesterase|nr:alpha/beta hydrolase [Caulobacterales bacterium]
MADDIKAKPTLAAGALGKADASGTPWKEGYFTVSDGTKLHYVEWGAGTPVILIHGAGGSAVGNWFANGIAASLYKTNRVIGLDMRGHGLSEAGPPNGRGNMAKDVIEFMAQQKIAKAHIAGYSMGGGVTMSLLASNPELFITAGLHGSGIGETKEWRERVPKDKEGADPEAAKASELYAGARRARGEEVGNGAGARRGAMPQMSEEERKAMAERREKQLEAIDLKRIKFPVICINGEYDRPYAKSHRLWRELDTFTNVVLPGKGHLSAVMAGLIPQAYIDAFQAFITSNNPK